MNLHHLESLRHDLVPLAPQLHEALRAARADTELHRALYAAEGKGWLRSEVFRAILGDHLVDCLPAGWTLDSSERQAHRGALLLSGSDGYIQARVQRVSSDGTLPEARSDSRRSFYDNEDLTDDILGRCRHNLVLTYEESGVSETFTVRAIRPALALGGTYAVALPYTPESFGSSRFAVVNDDSYEQLFGDGSDEQHGDAAGT